MLEGGWQMKCQSGHTQEQANDLARQVDRVPVDRKHQVGYWGYCVCALGLAICRSRWAESLLEAMNDSIFFVRLRRTHQPHKYCSFEVNVGRNVAS